MSSLSKTSKLPVIIKVCQGHACKSSLSNFTLERAHSDIEKLENTPLIAESSLCQGNCSRGPIVTLEKNGKQQQFTQVDAVEMGKIIKKFK